MHNAATIRLPKKNEFEVVFRLKMCLALDQSETRRNHLMLSHAISTRDHAIHFCSQSPTALLKSSAHEFFTVLLVKLIAQVSAPEKMALHEVQDNAEFDKILADSSRWVFYVSTNLFINLLLTLELVFTAKISQHSTRN